MSELEEIKAVTPEKKLTAPVRISPSSINSYMKCPREFYYNYIEKIKVPPNIHLVKGSVVHKVLELFYKEYQEHPISFLRITFKKEWKKLIDATSSIELTPLELSKHKKDAYRLVMDFYSLHKRKVDSLVENGKAENENHAFFLVKPKFREVWVEWKENEETGNMYTCGYIDRVHEDFNGIITLGDYKTSSKFGIGLPEEYKRQLAIYAFLYQKKTGLIPHFVSIIFLRYGEEYLLEVTPSLIEYARNTIEYVWSKTRTTNIVDYPLKEGNLCRFCPYFDTCSKEVDFGKKNRKESIKKVIANESKKE